MLDLPETVRRKAQLAGADGWLAELPSMVARLERDWSLRVGRTYQDATEAYVAAVELDGGGPAVLKLLVPRDGAAAAHETTVLRLAGGVGCVRLLRDDVASGAMLLERLGRSLADLDLAIARQHEILCGVAAAVWRPAPDSGLPSGADKGRWLIDAICSGWEQLDRPCSEAAVEHAVDCAGRRIAAHDDGRSVLVHGDLHRWNTLQAGAGFKLVDPDGLLAEAEYDLGVVMREDPEPMLHGDPFERARWLARRTGLDATAIWEWGVVERVSTGLIATSIGMQPVGRQMLAVADRVARERSGP